MTENALRLRSDEEDDLLARSQKKVKAKNVVGVYEVNISDASMEDKQSDEKKSEETPPKASFKDKLLGQFAPKGFSEEDEFGPIVKNEGFLSVTTKDSWPFLTTSEKLRECLNRKWKNFLIVKF